MEVYMMIFTTDPGYVKAISQILYGQYHICDIQRDLSALVSVLVGF